MPAVPTLGREKEQDHCKLEGEGAGSLQAGGLSDLLSEF